MRTLYVAMGTLALTVCLSHPLAAGIVTHTTLASFNAAAGGDPAIVNFDSTPVGTFIPINTSFGGITFQYGGAGFGAAQLRVTDGTRTGQQQLGTTSPTRFLGTDIAGDQLAAGGSNNFTMVFDIPVRSVGLSVILSANDAGQLFDGDFLLRAGNTSAQLNATLTPALPDGSRAFFLGLTEDTGAALGPITLSSVNATFGLRYRVDDIRSVVAVPEPSALAGGLWLLGLAGPFVRRSRWVAAKRV